MKGNASDDVRKMIHREREIMEGLKRMHASARNKTVRSQCDAQISEAERNIAYLTDRLNKLEVATTEKPASDAKDSSKLTRLDLLRWDKPQGMAARIQVMLQQLEYKLSIEQQYERGTCKLINLYKQTGDRRSQAEAYSNLSESTAKIALLKRSQKRYSDMNLAAVIGDTDGTDSGPAVSNVRRPLTGTLRIFITEIEEVDHTIAWSEQVEMWVSMKVENNSAAEAHTRPTTSSFLNEDFVIPVDKGNEIEFTVYDRAITHAGNPTPVALLWLRISDIAEAIRQKRVERELKETGWASADRVQAMNAAEPGAEAGAKAPANTGSSANGLPSPNAAEETSSSPGASSGSVTTNGRPNSNPDLPQQSGSALTGPPIRTPVSAPIPASPANPAGPAQPSENEETVEGWFTLEPAGRIYLKLGFEKEGSHLHKRPRVFEDNADLAKLGRHNAIRKREETQQVHGHEFVLQQSYNIVKCAVCGDFTTSYFQCQECKLTCDRKCFSKIVTKCRALMSRDPDEEINHRIPHQFEPFTNMKATWCAQCGFILPLASRRNVRKCAECSITVHTACAAFVPDLCGMSMTTAAQVINEINSTRIRQATKAAGRSFKPTAQRFQRPMSQYSTTSNTTLRSIPPPPKSAPVRRKQVPDKTAPPSVPEHAKSKQNAANVESARSKAVNVSQPAAPQIPVIPQVPVPSTQSGELPTPQPSQKRKSYLEPLEKLQPLDFDHQDILLPNVLDTGSESSLQSDPTLAPLNDSKLSVESPPSHESYTELESNLKSVVSPDPVLAQQPVVEPEVSVAPEVPGHYTAPVSEPAVPSAPSIPTAPIVPSAPSAPSVPSVTTSAPSAPSAPSADSSVVTAPSATEQPKPVAHRRRKKVGLDDFSFLAVLGKGNFGKVMLAESKHTGYLYAVKVLKKNFIIDNREVESTRSEKRVFLIANRERHPFLINLYACFQTENRIYFVMDYVSGGDLMFHIQQKMFTARRAQFYAAEVLLALKHFHENGVIYRDLKLDNILLSLDGHIKIADYGLCKENMDYGSTTGTFCGTPDFIAPEILLDQKYGRSVDWWALGVLMYQMLLGKSPFHGNDEDEVYDAILSDEPLYPIHMPRDSVSILQQLLTRDPSKRLGSGIKDAEEIMAHPYFANINFDDLLNLSVEPPYKPELDSPTDVRYFEREFTSEMPALTPMNSTVTPEMQEEFRGFSYSMGDAI